MKEMRREERILNINKGLVRPDDAVPSKPKRTMIPTLGPGEVISRNGFRGAAWFVGGPSSAVLVRVEV